MRLPSLFVIANSLIDVLPLSLQLLKGEGELSIIKFATPPWLLQEKYVLHAAANASLIQKEAVTASKGIRYNFIAYLRLVH